MHTRVELPFFNVFKHIRSILAETRVLSILLKRHHFSYDISRLGKFIPKASNTSSCGYEQMSARALVLLQLLSFYTVHTLHSCAPFTFVQFPKLVGLAGTLAAVHDSVACLT